MPATAGRVRMPANNRVHSSAALQTHGIWQSAIGYDPYAPTNNNEKHAKTSANQSSLGDGEEGGENAYDSYQGLLALVRITGTGADGTRGACKKCGRVGHLTFQCRNFLSLKQGREKDEAVAEVAEALFLEMKKGGGRKEEESEDEEDEEEDESSDSDLDPEIEKLIAARYVKNGRKDSERRGMSKMRSGKRSRYSDDEDEEEDDGRRKRRRKEERRYETSDDEAEKEARRRKSKKEGKRRRNHKGRHVSDDGSYDESNDRGHLKRSNKRTVDFSSDSDGTTASKHHRRRREKRRDRRRASSRTSDSCVSGTDVDDMENKSFKRRSRRDRRD